MSTRMVLTVVLARARLLTRDERNVTRGVAIVERELDRGAVVAILAAGRASRGNGTVDVAVEVVGAGTTVALAGDLEDRRRAVGVEDDLVASKGVRSHAEGRGDGEEREAGVHACWRGKSGWIGVVVVVVVW